MEWDNLYPPTNIRLRVDANNGTHVQLVIHELIHIVFHTMFIGFVDETLEEICIMSLDEYMYKYITKSPKRVALWNELIDKKLAVEGGKEYTLEERAAR